jgi:hypothetical protein
MPVVFNDPLLQKQFEDKGYVVVPSLLNRLETEKLSSLCQQGKNDSSGFFYTTHFSSDPAYKQQVHDAITAVVFPRATSYLNNFAPLFANFMIKNPDPKNAMDLHADWAYVEEPEHHSVSIWIPLVDVNEENGCLGIIEGSHKILNAIRGPLIHQTSRQRDNLWVKKYGKLLPMKAGDAILYDHALLHYSPPNKTSSVRPAINLSAAPANVQWIHYCMPEHAKAIEKYRVPDTNFFIRYNHFQRPETGTPIETLPADTVQFIDAKMERLRQPNILQAINKWLANLVSMHN